MYISRFVVKNFKSFRDVTFHFNSKLNVLTGVNNSGKTTVLEALSLWHECFSFLCRRSQRGSTKASFKQGDWIFSKEKQNYRNYQDVISVRSPGYQDIFYNLQSREAISLEAVMHQNGEELPIELMIRGVSGANYDIMLANYNDFDYAAFNRFFKHFPDPINATFVTPLAQIFSFEDYEPLPRVKQKVISRESVSVLRNRIAALMKTNSLPGSGGRYTQFLNTLNYVLYENQESLTLGVSSNELEDVALKMFVKTDRDDVEKDLSLLGSGTLQIIEILLSFFSDGRDMNLVMLDEPDSHIHRDIQKRLLQSLTTLGENTQIFLTTHNEKLIRSTPLDQLFLLEGNPEDELHSLTSRSGVHSDKGLQQGPIIDVLKRLDADAVGLLDALEADRLLLVEGKDDAARIRCILQRKLGATKKYAFWVLGGIDSLLNNIGGFREVLSYLGNGHALWDKTRIVLDKDYLTETQRSDLMETLGKRYSVPIHIWQAYTFESVLLTDSASFARALASFLGKQSPEQLDGLLRSGIGKIAEGYLDKMNQGLDERRLDDILRKSQKRADALGFNLKFGSNPLITWKEYARPLLENGEIYHLASKDDVHGLLQDIFAHFNRTYEPEQDFDNLLDSISLADWPSEWTKILELVQN